MGTGRGGIEHLSGDSRCEGGEGTAAAFFSAPYHRPNRHRHRPFFAPTTASPPPPPLPTTAPRIRRRSQPPSQPPLPPPPSPLPTVVPTATAASYHRPHRHAASSLPSNHHCAASFSAPTAYPHATGSPYAPTPPPAASTAPTTIARTSAKVKRKGRGRERVLHTDMWGPPR